MDILQLQQTQLSRESADPSSINIDGLVDFLGELSPQEGDLIPFVIRTGPMGRPDPGLLKRYEAVEINGEGRAFVMVWIQDRLVAWGTLFAQEGPKRPRRLNIPRGLGNGYAIDLYIAFQGQRMSFEVFYELVDGGEA